MSQIDPVFASVTAPGSYFEIGARDGYRQFVNAPTALRAMVENARIHGEKIAVVEGDRRLSYNQIFAWADRLAPLLGLRYGDRVAICMRNRTEWLVAYIATILAGGTAALLNSRGSPAELVAMIGEVAPRIVLADGERAALIREGGYDGRMFDLTNPVEEDALAALLPAGHMLDTTAAAAGDPVSILFTSGTTGRVKGAVLTNRSLTTGLLSIQLTGAMVLHHMAAQYGMTPAQLTANAPQQAVLLVYPLFHISGLAASFLSPFFGGAKIVILRRWDAKDAVRLFVDEGISAFAGVPTMLWDIVRAAEDGGVDLSGLRNIGSGGQALPVNLLHAVRQICPNAAMGTGYGMTECSGSIAQAVGDDFTRRPSSAGRVLPLVDVRIMDSDGVEVAPGQAGDICVRGAQVMAGYWNRPDDTAAVLSPDGWLNTGDIGMIDEEGYIYIIDRKKDMVISGGENIYCAEVERAMGELPGIAECATFGVPDDRLGEVLVAVVRATGWDAAALIHQVGEKLARYKAPARVAFVDEPLPRNAVDKVDKVKLRALWHALAGEES